MNSYELQDDGSVIEIISEKRRVLEYYLIYIILNMGIAQWEI